MIDKRAYLAQYYIGKISLLEKEAKNVSAMEWLKRALNYRKEYFTFEGHSLPIVSFSLFSLPCFLFRPLYFLVLLGSCDRTIPPTRRLVNGRKFGKGGFLAPLLRFVRSRF